MEIFKFGVAAFVLVFFTFFCAFMIGVAGLLVIEGEMSYGRFIAITLMLSFVCTLVAASVLDGLANKCILPGL